MAFCYTSLFFEGEWGGGDGKEMNLRQRCSASDRPIGPFVTRSEYEQGWREGGGNSRGGEERVLWYFFEKKTSRIEYGPRVSG